LKGYQTKHLMPPVGFCCFKCAIYICAGLSLCVYLSMYLFMLYDCLCLWFVYVWYVYLFICWFVIYTIYVCLIMCWFVIYTIYVCLIMCCFVIYTIYVCLIMCCFVIYTIYVCLIMCCFATFVHCCVFLKISSRLMVVRVQGRIKANVFPKHRRPLVPPHLPLA
jgi:hypothetical protein